jgi:uncharacterized protein YrzB (UPF0473 family)
MEENNDNIVELIDENNEKREFEYIDVVKYNGCEYVVLAPYDENEDDINENDDDDDDEVDVIIMKIVKDENGEEILETVEDEDELDSVFAEFSDNWMTEED